MAEIEIMYSKNGNVIPESVATVIREANERRRKGIERQAMTTIWQVRYTARSYEMFKEFIDAKILQDGPLGFEIEFSSRWQAVTTVGEMTDAHIAKFLDYVVEFESPFSNAPVRHGLETFRANPPKPLLSRKRTPKRKGRNRYQWG